MLKKEVLSGLTFELQKSNLKYEPSTKIGSTFIQKKDDSSMHQTFGCTFFSLVSQVTKKIKEL